MLLELIMALAAVPSPGGGCWQREEITFTGIWNKCSSSGGNNSTHLPHNLPMYQHLPRVPAPRAPRTVPRGSPDAGCAPAPTLLPGLPREARFLVPEEGEACFMSCKGLKIG